VHLDHDADEVEQQLLRNLFGYEWELTKSPAGAHQWTPKQCRRETVPDAHDPSKRHAPIDADHRPRAALRPGLREDLAALPREPGQFADAFARAWFKLTHRDMGPRALSSARWCRRKS
jgi:catalase-peroxidase